MTVSSLAATTGLLQLPLDPLQLPLASWIHPGTWRKFGTPLLSHTYINPGHATDKISPVHSFPLKLSQGRELGDMLRVTYFS